MEFLFSLPIVVKIALVVNLLALMGGLVASKMRYMDAARVFSVISILGLAVVIVYIALYFLLYW